jgi:succinate dehydrogenase hydrophobic anchor subunit
MINNKNLYRHSVTGFLVIPLFVWFLCSIHFVIENPRMHLPILFCNSTNCLFGIFFTIISLYHLNFELKYILQYRISLDKDIRYILFLFYDILSLIIGGSAIFAILNLYILNLIGGNML